MPRFIAILFRSLAAIGLVSLCGCSSVSAEPTQRQQADDEYRAGRFVAAERLYRAAVVAEPNNARAWERLGTIALWRNDLAGAASHFTNADRHTPWLYRHWPFNIQPNIHRALMHARAGRTREAAQLLARAAGPLPFGTFRELKIRSRQAALFDGQRLYQVAGPAETVVPFVITDPLPVVKVAVNGEPPAEFVIDTGGEGLTLDCRFARKAGVVMAGELRGEYAGGKKGLTRYGKVDAVRLGDMAVRNVPTSCIDLQPIAQTVFGGRAIKGIIGTGLLMPFLATLDYPRARLVLRRPAADAPAGTTEQGRCFPMWLVETHLIFVEGSVNNLEPGLMFIDTGLAGAGFHASQDILAAAGVVMDWSEAGMGAGGGGMTKGIEVSVAEVGLGHGQHAIRKYNLKGVAFENDLSLFKDALGFKVAGLISHQFFRDHAVTFDFLNMCLIVRD